MEGYIFAEKIWFCQRSKF